MSATSATLAGDEQGGAILSFALVLPIALALTMAVIDFALLLTDYHRANEATRRAARVAAIHDPIPDISGLEIGQEVVCTSSGGTVGCGGASVLQPAVFQLMLQEVREILPVIDEGDLTVAYANEGLGSADRPSGILPVITVRLNDVTFEFRALRIIPGAPRSLTMPTFRTVQVGGGRTPA